MTSWAVGLEAPDVSATQENDQPVFVIRDSLGYLVNRLARMMAHELAERIRPSGVGIGQWAILLILWARDGASQAELARNVAIEAPTVARTIDRMVRDGLVRRSTDADDARLSRIVLTQRGWDLRDKLIPQAVATNESVMAKLSATERLTLHRLLAKLA
jgi:DNA-binding MarR family transcriptional regulator